MLELRGLSVTYGNVRAIDRLDLRVNEGEVAALVGPNGAGKTSTMMAISGIVRPAAGEITFEGTRIEALPSHDIYKRGIVQVPEGRLILAEMTVRENLLLGADAVRTNGGRRGELDRVAELFPVLEERMHYRADTLSGGQLQMLAIARGLMGRPRLFMLDEPSLGLAPKVVEEVFQMIEKLNGMGMTILLVEQNLQKALGDHRPRVSARGGPTDRLRPSPGADEKRLRHAVVSRRRPSAGRRAARRAQTR